MIMIMSVYTIMVKNMVMIIEEVFYLKYLKSYLIFVLLAKPNPCLTSYNGFYLFAFSYFGHIECNMGRLYFRNGQLPKVDQYKEALGTYNTDK